jgi:hypothetical protein
MKHAEHVCRSKRAWSTETKAKVHALGVMNHPNPAMRSEKPIHVYRCPVCRLWHLTSISPEEWRRRSQQSAVTGHR